MIKECDRDFSKKFGGSSKMASSLRNIMNTPKVESNHNITIYEAFERGLLTNVNFRVAKKSKNQMISFDYCGFVKEITIEDSKNGRFTFELTA